jgi:RHS repeat-associated protein
MKNNTHTFGINKRISRIFHNIMLFAILHSSLIAPSQVMLTDYFNSFSKSKPLRYKGSELIKYDVIAGANPNQGLPSPIATVMNNNNSAPIAVTSGLDLGNVSKAHFVFPTDIKEGVIGVTKEQPLDDATDNLFKFTINETLPANSKVFLTYDLFGVQDANAVSKSINDRLATGGHIVKYQMGWTSQKEAIDLQWLRYGENKIMFTLPKGAQYQFRVKNLKVQVEKQEGLDISTLVLNNSNINYIKNNQLYLKGFIKNGSSKDVRVFADDTEIYAKEGAFEGFLTLTDALKNKKIVVVKAMDANGLLGQEIVILDNLLEADAAFPIEKTDASKTILFKANTNESLSIDGASLNVKDSILSEDKAISITQLRTVDIAPMASGMINVTKGGNGYRFLPDGTTFSKPVQIAIAYDEKLIPTGYSTKDIKTFYFNTVSKSWMAVKKDTIDEKERKIISLTTHFTDYVNGIIQTPESPETAGFTPTMMNDIKAVDPSSEMTIITPPEVSQKGDATVSYPIKIPAGRRGLQPELAIQYSNEGGNSWLGQGWNITVPAITIDTKWGVPVLDPQHETEIYSLNGEQLMYPKVNGQDWMPNRHQVIGGIYDTSPIARTSNVIFTPRKQGSFALIERLGTSTSDYYWKVTATNGTVNWYGGKDAVVNNAVIKNADGEIVHWGLYMTQDIHGNCVKYTYRNTVLTGQSGLDANLNNGRIFQILSIHYNGFNDDDYKYLVQFNVSFAIRQDASINGRLGVKQIEPYFLNNILVRKTDVRGHIRKYTFKMGYGKFGKGQLVSASELDKDNKEFYTHTFEYYDDLAQDGTDVYFSSGVEQTICNDVPVPPCLDNDNDGVCNNMDSCIDEAGPASNNGCPVSDNCFTAVFPVPSNTLYYYYSGSNNHGYVVQDHIGCVVTSDRFYALGIDGTYHSSTANNIFLVHGAGNDPSISRCPSYPLTTTPDPITRNPDYDTRLTNFFTQKFAQLNMPLSGFNTTSIASSRIQETNSWGVNNSSHRFIFYSPVMFDLSFQFQQGTEHSQTLNLPFWNSLQSFNTVPCHRQQLTTNANAVIYINNSTTPFGTYDLNNTAQFSQFQALISSTYPTSTVTLVPANGPFPLSVSIVSNNTNLNSITIVPVSTNESNTYTFADCNSSRSENVAGAKGWKNLKLSREETEYGINRWIADGLELEIPIEDITLDYTVDFTNNPKDASVKGIYLLELAKDKETWKDSKGNEIIFSETINKLKTICAIDFKDLYAKLNEENKSKEIQRRKTSQQEAIVRLEEYYKNKDFSKNTTPIQPKGNNKPVSFGSNNATNTTNYTNYFHQLLNNYTIGFSGSTVLNPNCPTFINSNLLISGHIPSFNSAGAILGSSYSENFNVGGHLGFGIDFSWDVTTKNITIGGGYNHSWDNSESLTSLIDINGDGLDDMVFKHFGQLYWKRHIVTRTYDAENEPVVTHSFGPYSSITSMNNEITDFYKSDGESSSWNIQVNFGFSGVGAFAGWDTSKNKSRNNIYFTDGNGDGLMDIVKYGTVYFNRIDGSGNPYFEPQSLNTPNMLIEAAPVTVTTPPTEIGTTTPNFDVVKVWEAPANGAIKIDNSIQLTDTSREAVVTIEMNKPVPPLKCYTVSFPTPVINTELNRYQIPYYQLSSQGLDGANNNCNTTSSIVRVSYFSVNNTPFNPLSANLYQGHFNENTNTITNLCNTVKNPNFENTFKNWLNQNPLNQFNIIENVVVNTAIYETSPTIRHRYNLTGSYFISPDIFTAKYNLHWIKPSWATLPGTITVYDTPRDIDSYGFIVSVGIPTTISINGAALQNNPYTLYDATSFSQFQNQVQSQFIGSSVTLNSQTNMVTVSINNTNQVYSTISLSATNGSSTNTYNFTEVTCDDLRPISAERGNEIVARQDDWKAYKPSNEEFNLAFKKYVAAGKEMTEPLNENISINYMVDATNNSTEKNITGVYMLLIEKNKSHWIDANGVVVSDNKTISVLNQLLSVDVEKMYADSKEKYKEDTIARKKASQVDAQIWLDEYYKKQNKENSQKADNLISRTVSPTTCEFTPGELCKLYGTRLNAATTSVTNTLDDNCDGETLTVKKGDRIYFRVHSIATGNPAVNWDPKVTYTNTILSNTVDQNGITPYQSRYSDGFILSQEAPVIFPGNGNVTITWDQLNVVNPTDEVTYEIVKRTTNGPNYTDTPIFTRICAPNASTSVVPMGLNSLVVSGSAASQITQFIFRVRATSNVNWKAFEWKPRMVCTTTQPVVGNSGNEGNVTTSETKYPTVDYSIYKDYLCGAGYQVINLSSMNTGGGVYLTPSVPNSIFTSSDNGVLNYVVKRNNTFVGRRKITVVNGAATITPSSSMLLTGSGPTIEISITTDDSKRVVNSPTDVSLLRRVLNTTTLGYISGGSTDPVLTSKVNIMHKPLSLYGPMYRQWGQFMYNPLAATGAIPLPELGVNLLKEELLTITNAQATALQGSLLNGNNDINSDLTTLQNIDMNSPTADATIQSTLQSIQTNSGINNFPFSKANPSRDFEGGVYIDKWIGLHNECYSGPTAARAATLSQSFSFPGVSTTSQASFNTGAYGIDKISKGEGQSISGGGSFGGFGASGTRSLGGVSNSLTDYIDLNGDRYPDIVTTDQVQYTLKTGGLFTPEWRGGFSGDMSTDNNGSWGFTASGSFGKSGKPNAGSEGAKIPANGKLTIGKPATCSFGGGSNSVGISGNFGQGDNNTSKLWADVNGDGLPDIISKNSGTIFVQLNLGNTIFNANNNWGSFSLASGKSTTFGGGLGFNYANGSIEAGVSLGRTDSDTENTLVDLNGDGMLDKISSNSSGISVDYNRGNKFSNTPVPVSSFSYYDSATTTNMGLNGTGTFSLIWPLYLVFIVIPLKIPDVSVTASGGTSVNRTKKSIADFDGDGYADLIEEISSNSVRVHSSRIRRTDMLKSVTNPLGGKFTIDYKVQNVDYNNPNAKWNMCDLIIEDGYDKVNDGKDKYAKRFIYENGKFDRREREFYGYETVKVQDYAIDDDGAPLPVYRTSVSRYNNTSYFLNSLLLESYVIKGDDDNAKFSRTENTYQVRELNADNSEMTTTVLPDTFDVGGTEGRRTAAVVLTKTMNYLYELSPSPMLISEIDFEYDSKGRVETYSNLGNINDSSDDYFSKIGYHNLPNNILNVPQLIEVYDNSGTVKRRTTDVDSSNGNIEGIHAFIDSSVDAVTHMKYDIYGNLEYIEYPAGDNGQLMYRAYKYDDVYHKYIVQIDDAFGYSSSAIYDSNFDKILETTDLTGNHMYYEYDSFGRNTIILAPKEKDAGREYTIKFEYFPLYSNVANTPYEECVDKNNFAPFSITSHFDVQHAEPANDIQTINFIDGLGRPMQVKKDIELNVGDPHDPIYKEAMSVSGKIMFDDFGRAIKQFHPYFEDKDCKLNYNPNEYESPYSTTTAYDELDRPISTLDPANNQSTMEYSIDQDINGTMAVKTLSKVDQNGSQSIVTETYKDVSGKTISTMNDGPNGAIWTKFNYNAIGELLSYTDAENITTKYEYDWLGRKIAIHHPDNGTTTFKYDNASNLMQLQTANLAANTSLDPADRFVKYSYQYNRLEKIRYPDNPNGSDNISNVIYKYGDTGNETGRLIYQADATGTQEFKYGNMGETIYNKRVVVGPNIPTRVFETHFSYDSWNRLQKMQYPDGEAIAYNYDLGGNLIKMTGNLSGAPYDYIKRIDYDYYEQRTYLLYGNKTETFYKYSPELRRLQNLNVKTSDGNDLYNNNYDYDYVGNIVRLTNNASITTNNMGGNYNHRFGYDQLNRLERAEGNFVGSGVQNEFGNDSSSDYSLGMRYNNTHGIEQKSQKHYKNGTIFVPNSYTNDYQYYNGTHKLKAVNDSATGLHESFNYDNNGNLVNKQSSSGNMTSYLWDESNRLRVVAQENGFQHYVYDAVGERVLKANTDNVAVYENGTLADPASVIVNGYTTYPSAFLVIDVAGLYSKHYYAGAQRIVSKMGEQNASIFETESTLRTSDAPAVDYKKMQQAQLTDLKQWAEKAKVGKLTLKEFKPHTYEELEKSIKDELLEDKNANKTGENIMAAPINPIEIEIPPIYYYHPDHLGTSTFLTDSNGNAYQFFLNLPFGETMAEQLPSSYYKTPYKFNAKELDEETGLYYYGARYYDPRISIWYSVDPMADKFPAMNPYVYCNQNPIDLTDPKGLYPDPPSMKTMLEIYPTLNRKATIYVLQEIPQRNQWGQIMTVAPEKRKYQQIKINDATEAGQPIIYIAETFDGWDSLTKTNNPSYTYNDGDSKSYKIGFNSNSNDYSNDHKSSTYIKDMAQAVKKTGDTIQIVGSSDKPEGASSYTRIDGVDRPNGGIIDDIVQARAQKIYNDLISAGVPPDQLQIVAPSYDTTTSTKITINKPALPIGITPEQIVE